MKNAMILIGEIIVGSFLVTKLNLALEVASVEEL